MAVADSVSPNSPRPEGFLVHLAGHVLLFDKRPAPDFNASAGVRLLAIAIVVEALRFVASGERAHAESPLFPDLPGVNSNALSIQVILCRRRIVFGRPRRAFG